MVITLTYCGTKKGTKDNVKIYFPVNPQEIQCKGSTYFQEYNIINKGPVKIPVGDDVSSVGWECFFPVKRLKSNPYVVNKNKWKTPKSFQNQIEKWKSNGRKLKLNITGTPINMWVYIDVFDPKYQDAYGNVYYSIEFIKAIDISVEKVKKKASKSKNKTSGTRASNKTAQKKYTIKKGDTLWGIAKKYYKSGAQWKKIYNANKSTIEKAAKKHGKKSSSNGHWIYPGTQIKIP